MAETVFADVRIVTLSQIVFADIIDGLLYTVWPTLLSFTRNILEPVTSETTFLWHKKWN